MMQYIPVGGAFIVLTATLVSSLAGLFAFPRWIEGNLFRPYWLVRRHQYYTLLTSGLIHKDVAHLFFNSLTFYFFAFPLERVIGTARFSTLYLLGLILSNTSTYVRHRNDAGYASLGASGAVSAVLFAAIVYFPTASLFVLPIPVPIPAPLFAVGYLAYSWYSSRRADGVNHGAHFDGAVIGVLFVAATDPAALLNLARTLGWSGG